LPNAGPALRVSLKDVGGRERALGAAGADVCGVSEVVAKVRSGVRERGTVRRVEDAKRHRDRGIEAAIVVCTYIREGGKRELYMLTESLQYPHLVANPRVPRHLSWQEQPTRPTSLQAPPPFEGIFNVANSRRQALVYRITPSILTPLPANPIARQHLDTFTYPVAKATLSGGRAGQLLDRRRASSRSATATPHHGQEARGCRRRGPDRQDVGIPRR
jgi:hypothetical protein